DQVSRLTPPAPQPSSTRRPSNLQSQPLIASRMEDGSNGAGSSPRYAIPLTRLRGYLYDTLKRFPDRCRIMYQRDAHKIAAGVGAVPVFVSQVNTWQDLDTAPLPDG